jgi:hypothetical protein
MVYSFTYKMLQKAISEIVFFNSKSNVRKAISERISSDLDSITSRLQGLANSVYLQQGDLSSNKTFSTCNSAQLKHSGDRCIHDRYVDYRHNFAAGSTAMLHN